MKARERRNKAREADRPSRCLNVVTTTDDRRQVTRERRIPASLNSPRGQMRVKTGDLLDFLRSQSRDNSPSAFKLAWLPLHFLNYKSTGIDTALKLRPNHLRL